MMKSSAPSTPLYGTASIEEEEMMQVSELASSKDGKSLQL